MRFDAADVHFAKFRRLLKPANKIIIIETFVLWVLLNNLVTTLILLI